MSRNFLLTSVSGRVNVWVMIKSATYSFWYFSYPLPAEAIARLI